MKINSAYTTFSNTKKMYYVYKTCFIMQPYVTAGFCSSVNLIWWTAWSILFDTL